MITVARGAARVVRAAIPEVGVHASLLRREPVGWVVLEQGLKQLESSLLQAGDNGGIGTLPLGESGLVVGE